MPPCARAAPVLALATGLASGCVADLEATLVPLFGCGIEREIDRLVLTARGDFSRADAPPVLLEEGRDGLTDLPEDVQGVTVEGYFGDAVLVAVGRTARLHDEGELPVYFSPRDRLCPVESALPGRDIGAMAVGEAGDVVVVGGIEGATELSRDILHYRDVDREGELRLGVGRLPWPSRAQTLHPIGDRRFLVLGGVTSNDRVLAQGVTFEVGDTADDVVVGDTIDLAAADVPDPARAHHAGALLPDGRILVTGGCATTVGSECAPVIDGALESAFYVEPSGDGVVFDTDVPPLNHERFGHTMLVSRDGLAFVVGGWDYEPGTDGSPYLKGVVQTELLFPGLGAWSDWGAPFGNDLGAEAIVGATLLEGGLFVVVTDQGRIWAFDEVNKWRLQSWCENENTPPCFVSSVVRRHTLLALPGERVLADNFLLPVAQVGRDGTAFVDITHDDLAMDPPPGPRAGADMAVLDDGSVIMAGGLQPSSAAQSTPVLLRFRPQLDGPDEREPVLEGLPPGSLMTHDGSTTFGGSPRTEVVDGTLFLRPNRGLTLGQVGVWVHVRAFLSRRFRLQATIGSEGDALPRFVFSYGTVSKNIIAIDPDEVRFVARDRTGHVVEVTCADRGLDFRDQLLQVVVDVSPEAVELRHQGEAIARCPWVGNQPVAVGIGAVGDGTVTARSLGLSRG